MFDRVGEVVSVVLGALALGYLIYEIDRRKRKLRDLFYVLDSEMRTYRPSCWIWSTAGNSSLIREGAERND